MKRVYLLIIILLSLLSGYLFVNTTNESGFSRAYVLKNIASNKLGLNENCEDYKNVDLPVLKIKYDSSIEQHLNSLKSLILACNWKDYNKKNSYFKGTLKIEEKKYKVTIKVHGKSPDGHIYKDHLSLKIKFKDSKNPFGKEKIKLIVANRIQTSFDNNVIVGKFFNVLHTEGRWVNVKINNKDHFPYLVQYPLKNIRKDESSLVMIPEEFNLNISESEFNKLLEKESLNREELLGVEKVRQLREAIKNNDIDQVLSFFDSSYIKRYSAAIVCAGFVGHGFCGENLQLFIDSASHLLYPAISRDFFISPLNNGANVFQQVSYWSRFWFGKYAHTENYPMRSLFQSVPFQNKVLKEIERSNKMVLDDLCKKFDVYDKKIKKCESGFARLFENEEPLKIDTRITWGMYNPSLLKRNLDLLQKKLLKKGTTCHVFRAESEYKYLFFTNSIFPIKADLSTFDEALFDMDSLTLSYIRNKDTLIVKQFENGIKRSDLKKLFKGVFFQEYSYDSIVSERVEHEICVVANTNKNCIFPLEKMFDLKTIQGEKIPSYIVQPQDGY